MRTVLSFAVGVTLALAAPSVWAQDASATATAGATVETPKPAPKPAAVKDDDKDDGVSDHEKYAVGHLAVGYLGLTSIPIATGGANSTAHAFVKAPVIGLRYWMSEKLGIDVGLGFALANGSTEQVTGPQTVTTDQPSVFAFAIHGGVPLVFAHHKHYKFLVVPELNLGFATSTQSVVNPPAGTGDISHTGSHLDAGALVGGEIHFGFIGVPHLSLQASVGLYGRRDAWKSKQDVNNTTNSSAQSVSGFGTSVQSDPWALFVNNISALYYFP